MHVRPDFPLPDTEWPGTREYWAGAARGELCIPRCSACGRYVWYPEPRCPDCAGESLRWTAMSGRGSLFSWTIVHHAFLPQFKTKLPFVAALVALEEDVRVRIVTNLVDCGVGELRPGLALRAVFRPLEFPGIERRVMAPMFTPAWR
jgi:uncharacterized OB-fold protein